jgi:hypothetical protein
MSDTWICGIVLEPEAIKIAQEHNAYSEITADNIKYPAITLTSKDDPGITLTLTESPKPAAQTSVDMNEFLHNWEKRFIKEVNVAFLVAERRYKSAREIYFKEKENRQRLLLISKSINLSSLREQFGKIADIPGLETAIFYKTHMLIVTKPIICYEQPACPETKQDGYYLGPFDIKLDFAQNLCVSVRPHEQCSIKTDAYGIAKTHPHGSSNDFCLGDYENDFCLGDYEDALQNAIVNFDYVNFISILLDYLGSYNPNDNNGRDVAKHFKLYKDGMTCPARTSAKWVFLFGSSDNDDEEADEDD